jgi:hypothetical protein
LRARAREPSPSTPQTHDLAEPVIEPRRIAGVGLSGFRGRVLAGERLVGTFPSLGSPLTSETVGEAGLDWAIIDLEHGLGGEWQALAQV